MGLQHHSDRSFELRDWLPYQLVVTADEVSRAFADVYRARYGLTRQQWRVLAAVAANPGATLAEVSAFSTVEKMDVSRAVARLVEAKLLSAATGANDRRKRSLSLTAEGRNRYRELARLALQMERDLLDGLEAGTQQALRDILPALRGRARELRAAHSVRSESDL